MANNGKKPVPEEISMIGTIELTKHGLKLLAKTDTPLDFEFDKPVKKIRISRHRYNEEKKPPAKIKSVSVPKKKNDKDAKV